MSRIIRTTTRYILLRAQKIFRTFAYFNGITKSIDPSTYHLIPCTCVQEYMLPPGLKPSLKLLLRRPNDLCYEYNFGNTPNHNNRRREKQEVEEDSWSHHHNMKEDSFNFSIRISWGCAPQHFILASWLILQQNNKTRKTRNLAKRSAYQTTTHNKTAKHLTWYKPRSCTYLTVTRITHIYCIFTLFHNSPTLTTPLL